jgi:hypothetical protein
MYIRFGLVIVALIIIWLVIKLLRSPKFDKFCNDMVEGNLDTKPTSKDTINDIKDAEKDLGKRADKYNKEAEKLEVEASGINDFLSDRGVSKTKKKEGG